MRTLLKNITISIVLGLLAYEAIKLFIDGALAIPGTTPEISTLLIIIAAVFVATLTRTGGTFAKIATIATSATSTDRETGTVKWFNVRKGYGFITRDQGDDVFVHFRNIDGTGRRSVTEGQRVSFVVTTGDKGLQADKVNDL
jgi:CspA family cold shock protein